MPYKDRDQQLQAQKDHYAVNREAYLARLAERRARTKSIIRSVKERPCTDCGVQYPFYVMQLDHLQDKKFSMGRCGIVSVERLMIEIAKCEVVCANCHAERTFQRTREGSRTLTSKDTPF